jgi:hypothetical protein
MQQCIGNAVVPNSTYAWMEGHGRDENEIAISAEEFCWHLIAFPGNAE